MIIRSHDGGNGHGRHASAVSEYGRLGPNHWSLPETLVDSDPSESTQILSKSGEDIFQMRQELIQSRLQQTSQGNSSSLDSWESRLAAVQPAEMMTWAEEASITAEQVEALQKNGITDQVPRNSNGQLTSIGSLGHEDKNCRPCLFWLQIGCKKGLFCTYCHVEAHMNDRRKGIRPSKSTRDRIRKKREKASEHLETSGAGVQMQPEEHAAGSAPLPTRATGAQDRNGYQASRSGKLVQL